VRVVDSSVVRRNFCMKCEVCITFRKNCLCCWSNIQQHFFFFFSSDQMNCNSKMTVSNRTFTFELFENRGSSFDTLTYAEKELNLCSDHVKRLISKLKEPAKWKLELLTDWFDFLFQCSWGKENVELSNAHSMQQWQQVMICVIYVWLLHSSAFYLPRTQFFQSRLMITYDY